MRKNISTKTIPRLIISTMTFVCLTMNGFAQPIQKGYAPVNGLKMYYEVYGEGKPLVLLHGAFNTINMAFGQLIPELAKGHKVIAVELQGHGRTTDIYRPFSFESMADDVVALLKYLKIDSTDVMGYSMGGGVAQQLAIRYPKMVRRLILTSTVYKYEGWSTETRAILPMLTPQMFEGTPIKTAYDSLAPDPKHWKQFINKMKQFVTTPYNFGADKIKAIKSPTLIIAADGDGVSTEHVVEMYRFRGGGYMVDFGPVPAAQLAIFPGSSHISVMFQTQWLTSMIIPFLDASLQQTRH